MSFQRILLLFTLALIRGNISQLIENQCRISQETISFERQLYHLHYLPSNVRFPSQLQNTIVDDSQCTAFPVVSPIFLNEHSVCPWDMIEDIDENRYPQVLNFAKCRCSHCLSPLGDYECRPISYRIPVFEKRCVGDTMQYVKTYIDVPVGCTCARPIVVDVSRRVFGFRRRTRQMRLKRSANTSRYGKREFWMCFKLQM